MQNSKLDNQKNLRYKDIKYNPRSVIKINELIENEKLQATMMFEHMNFILEHGKRILDDKEKGYIDTDKVIHLGVATELMQDFLQALQDTISDNKKKFL